jgi:modulator of FtsH protease HflC
MKSNPLTLIIGCILLILFALLLVVFQVRRTEVAVVTTFGKPTRDLSEPGPYLKWPWPIQKVYKFDNRVQNYQDQLIEGLTSDSFNLLTSVYVGWKITNAKVFFPKFAGYADPINAAEQVLDRLLANAQMAVVSDHPLVDFLSTTPQQNKFVGIEHEILQSVESQLQTNSYGMDLQFLGFKKLELPEAVTQAVFDRMKAERKVLAQLSISQGESQASQIHSTADLTSQKMLAAAQGTANEIRGKAEEQAATSILTFEQNPQLANFMFDLDALEGSLKDHSILVFDQHTPPFNLLRGVSPSLLTDTTRPAVQRSEVGGRTPEAGKAASTVAADPGPARNPSSKLAGK